MLIIVAPILSQAEHDTDVLPILCKDNLKWTRFCLLKGLYVPIGMVSIGYKEKVLSLLASKSSTASPSIAFVARSSFVPTIDA